ncbi:MAG: hypothetical protein OEV94_11805 [Deltaproteobacteria bacterium]|nr:hypothetical protein [Deltaproteobacteria bacterium]
MDRLIQIRDQIVAALAPLVPGGNCQAHDGRFNLDNLKTLATKTPALLAACLGIPKIEMQSQGDYRLTAQWAVFVLGKDLPAAGGAAKTGRGAAALALAQAVLLTTAGNRWGAANTQAPTDLKAENLFSAPADQAAGLALWAVSWRQTVEVQAMTAADIAALNDFLRFYADWDLAPKDGTPEAQDHINLP